MFRVFSFVTCLMAASLSVLQAQDSEPSSKKAPETFDVGNARVALIDNTVVASRDPGIIERVDVMLGQPVEEDTVLAQLETGLYAEELAAAENEFKIAVEEASNDVDLRYAVKSADVNRQVLDRSQRAVAAYAKSVSGTEIERLRLELNRAQLSLEQAKRTQKTNRLTKELRSSQVRVAKLRLENRTIRSPLSGVVVDVFKQKGEWAAAGEPIARVVSTRRLRILCGTKASLVEPSRISDMAEFVATINGEEVVMPARVIFVSPELTISQDYKITAEVENEEGKLRAGLAGVLRLKLKD